MLSRAEFHLFAALLLLACPSHVFAEKLQITSNPSGATVEIDGASMGTTPLEKEYPGGYFHRTKTSLGTRLEHPMIARLSLAGFATKELTLTEGPMNWISLNGHNRGEYWLLKSDHFHVDLTSISESFTGRISARVADSSVSLQPELSLEELVRQTKPAVLYLKGLDKSGSGFFITGTGVIVTNAHVARDQESLTAVLSGGLQLQAKVTYIDPELDIAFAKVDVPATNDELPHLALADASSVRQGESVLAIGNPGDAMLFSVTKGIVSAVGQFPNAGPGTWIQTDAPINPGNSGGPLLNSRGEVIGINTQKLVKKNVSGIGFALSSTDVLAVLRRFYPKATFVTHTAPPPPPALQNLAVASGSAPASGPPEPQAAAPPAPEGFGTVSISSEPDGAEIFVDEKFLGNTPASLRLPIGSHVILLKFPGHADWQRTLEILKSSRMSLKATLDESK